MKIYILDLHLTMKNDGVIRDPRNEIEFGFINTANSGLAYVSEWEIQTIRFGNGKIRMTLDRNIETDDRKKVESYLLETATRLSDDKSILAFKLDICSQFSRVLIKNKLSKKTKDDNIK